MIVPLDLEAFTRIQWGIEREVKDVNIRLREACAQEAFLRPVLCYDQHFDPSFTMGYHSHMTMELMYALDEAFECRFINRLRQKETVTIYKGQALIINTSVYHKLVITAPTRIHNIEFEPTRETADAFPLKRLTEASMSFQNIAINDPDYLIESRIANWLPMFHTLFDILTLPTNVRKESQALYDIQLSLGTGIFWSQIALAHSSTSCIDKSYNYVERAKSYIRNRCSESINVQEIADYVHLHPTYLERLFKLHMAMSIIEYINKQRIDNACYLLRTSDKSIESIGFEVGYNSRQHFARSFRKCTGISPKDYRRNQNIKSYSQDDLFLINRIDE